MGFTAKPKTLYGDDLNHGRNQETDGYVQLPTRLEAEVTGRLLEHTLDKVKRACRQKASAQMIGISGWITSRIHYVRCN